MSKTRFSLKADIIKTTLIKKRPEILSNFDPSKVCIVVPHCVGYSEKLEELRAETTAIIEGALQEGYTVQLLVAPKDTSVFDKWQSEHREKLEVFRGHLNFQMINKLEFVGSKNYEIVGNQFDAYYQQNEDKLQKLNRLKMQDLGRYISNHKNETFDEDHPIVEAKLFISLAKVNKDAGYIATSFWYPKFSDTQGHACELVERMDEIGCLRRDLILVATGRERIRKELYDVVSEKENEREVIIGKVVKKDVSNEPSNKKSSSLPLVTVSAGIVQLCKNGVDAKWAAQFTRDFIEVADSDELICKLIYNKEFTNVTLSLSAPHERMPVAVEVIEEKFKENQDNAFLILIELGKAQADTKWTAQYLLGLLRNSLSVELAEHQLELSSENKDRQYATITVSHSQAASNVPDKKDYSHLSSLPVSGTSATLFHKSKSSAQQRGSSSDYQSQPTRVPQYGT